MKEEPHYHPQLCRRCITYKTLKTSHSHLHFSKAKVSHLTLSQAVSGGGGIFTVKMPFFSGKTAENVMGVYGFDCPAIF